MNLTKLENKSLPDDIRLDQLEKPDLMMVYMLCKLTLPQMAEIEERLGLRPARAA